MKPANATARFALTISTQLSNGPTHGAGATRDATTWKSEPREDSMRFDKILVPLGGSLLAEAALRDDLAGHRSHVREREALGA